MNSLKEKIIPLIIEGLIDCFKRGIIEMNKNTTYENVALLIYNNIATLTEQINAESVNSHCRRSHTDKMGRHKTVEKPEPISNPDELRSAEVEDWLTTKIAKSLNPNAWYVIMSAFPRFVLEQMDWIEEYATLKVKEALPSNTQQKEQPRMTADKMNCLEHSLEMWNDNNSLKLFYNSNHVIAIEEGYLIARRIPNPWYEPIENYGYDHIVKSFELCAKYALILASYLHNANQFKQ